MRVTGKHVVIGCALVLVLATLFTFLAVYDSDRLSFPERLTFWGSTFGVGIAAAGFATPWVVNGPLRTHAMPVQLIALTGLISLPVPIVLFWFDTRFGSTWPISNWALQYFLSFIIAGIIVAGAYVTLKASGSIEITDKAASKDDKDAVQKLLKRFPIKFHGASLYAISSEDHYLRIHTDRGEELMLMRLADAVQDLETADGLQTHRSWWVARAGVAKVQGPYGKRLLTLKSGAVVPVARSRDKLVMATLSLDSR